jgi:WD40 repeat protein
MSLKLDTVYAPSPNTERGKATRITTSPKGEDLVYCSGPSVIIRNVQHPEVVKVFGQHRVDTSVASISPYGTYCASADIQGNIIIWDTTNQFVKYQKKSLELFLVYFFLVLNLIRLFWGSF